MNVIVSYLKKNPCSRPTAIAKEIGKDITYSSYRLQLLDNKRVKRDDRRIGPHYENRL